MHFSIGEAVISIRLSRGDYPDFDQLLAPKKPKKITLPRNLIDILTRAEVMQEDKSYDSTVSISITKGLLELLSRKDSGWYKETKRVKWSGRPLKFEVNPQFLKEVLEKSNRVEIDGDLLRIQAGDAVFVVCLSLV